MTMATTRTTDTGDGTGTDTTAEQREAARTLSAVLGQLLPAAALIVLGVILFFVPGVGPVIGTIAIILGVVWGIAAMIRPASRAHRP